MISILNIFKCTLHHYCNTLKIPIVLDEYFKLCPSVCPTAQKRYGEGSKLFGNKSKTYKSFKSIEI